MQPRTAKPATEHATSRAWLGLRCMSPRANMAGKTPGQTLAIG